MYMARRYTHDRQPQALRGPAMVLVLVLALGTPFCRAYDLSGGYPIGPATIPPSSYGNDLVPRSNPIDTSGNLVMTGNVAAGMHFRGNVPYRAATDLRTPLGSTYLDAFLRDSQGAWDAGPRLGGMVPFYSSTATVTRMAPGSADLLTPSGGWAGFVLSNTMAPEALEGATSGGASAYTPTPSWPSGIKMAGQTQQTIGPNRVAAPWTDLQAMPSRAVVPSATPEQVLEGLPDSPEGLDASQPVDGTTLDVDGQRGHGLAQGGWGGEDPCRMSELGIRLPSQRKTVYGAGSLDAFWQVRYEQCMEKARTDLKEGRPRQAADAYTLAIMYKPADTLALAGKSQALFVCGEFVGSALFLTRALDVCPDYAKTSIDLAGAVGGAGVLRSRIEEARNYLRQDDCAELRLVLAYVYYRLGDIETARQTIETAADKGPPLPALQVLKRAIGGTVGGQTP